MISRRFRADAILLLTAVIWGSAFAAQRVAAEHIGVFLFNSLRFLVGAALLLPFAGLRHNLNRRTLIGPILSGMVLFTASALQQAGLQYTTAANAGFITSLYVVLVPVYLLLFLRQQVRWLVWLAVGIAIAGALLLSTGGQGLDLAPGDGLELIGAGVWALHVIVVDRFAKQMKPLAFSVGQFLVAAALNLVVGLSLESHTLPGVATAWWTVAYIGIFSTAGGYTLQILGQRHAPPTDAALIMSLESVFAAFFGALFLAEVLNVTQMAGCGLILAGVALAQIRVQPVPQEQATPELG